MMFKEMKNPYTNIEDRWGFANLQDSIKDNTEWVLIWIQTNDT